MKTRALAFLIATTACGGADRSFFLPLPPAEGQQSIVIGIHRENELTMLAADLGTANSALERTFDDADTFSLEALLYDRPLALLDLPAGTLELDSSADELDEPNEVYTTAIHDTDVGTWTRENTWSETLASFRAKRSEENRCPSYEIGFNVTLGGSADHTFILQLGDEKVLIGLLDGTIVVVKSGGEVMPLSTRPISLPIGSAFIDDAGDMFFGGRNGEIWRGRYVETSTHARIDAEYFASSGRDGIVRFMTGGPVGGGYEMFTLDDKGHFERLYGTEWTSVFDFGEIEGVRTKGGLVRLGPGHVVAASGTSSKVIRFFEGREHDDSPAGLDRGITAVGRTTRGGVHVSTGDGYMYASTGLGVWESLGKSAIAVDVYTFFEVSSGFLYGGALGHFAERNGNEYCEEEVLGAGSIRAITAFGDGYLLAQDKPQGDFETAVTLVRRLP